MTIAYDLLIVGGTLQGRRAAALAAREGARVALVEAPGQVEQTLGHGLGIELLAQAARIGFGLDGWDSAMDASRGLTWADLQRRLTLATECALAPWSPRALSTLGVDVVMEAGHFNPKTRLAFTTESRHLRARGYLLCPPTQTLVPALPGLATTPYRTLEDLPRWEDLPTSAVIIGRSPAALALAQSLAGLGRAVTVLSRGDRLLPTEDGDVSLLAEQFLRAAGVEVRLAQRPRAVTYDGEFRMALEDGSTLRAQQVILGTAQQPQTVGLNLASLGLRPHRHGLSVDDRLSTAHPRVFACGPALGGYWATATDGQDIPIAVRNALYLPHRRLTPLNRPGILPMGPALGRVGLTASQAQRWFGPEALVVQIPLGNAIAPHLSHGVTGLCRWVVHRDGRLLGAQIWADGARDLIQTVAWMMQNDLRIQHWDRISALPYSHSDILEQVVMAWQRQRWRPGTWRRDWAENWFNWRRSRTP